jgi:hypothetical protein
MMRYARVLFVTALLVCLLGPLPAEAATEATLLRLFLLRGGTVVSYGEYARLGDRVVFSMPVGGPLDQPQLQLVTLPASAIDWPRTESYASSARRQWYAATRGEQDFEQLNEDVARVWSEIAVSTDRKRALDIAQRARQTLAEWPVTHFGYRAREVQEITSLLDEAISNLRVSLGGGRFELALMASTADVHVEPVLGMPTPREQLDQLLAVADLVNRTERLTLLRTAIDIVGTGNAWIPRKDADAIRRSAMKQIADETAIDKRYGSMSSRVMNTATRAAARGDLATIERLFDKIGEEDKRLGSRRPEDVQALRTSVQVQLDAARRYRLLKDRYVIRQGLYRDYQRSMGVQMLQLAKIRSALEAIRDLKGPAPETLVDLRNRLTGGADRLRRIGAGVPQDLQDTHGLFESAWRFAETAVNARFNAVSSANVGKAWEASSAAAAAMLLLTRAQTELRNFVEPPRFQ